MSKLLKLEVIIKELLESDPETREDDMYLYYRYCMKCPYNISFAFIFSDNKYRENFNLCVYSSVERCRRKIQHDHPELCSEKVQNARINKEKEYIDYDLDYSYTPSLKYLIDKED